MHILPFLFAQMPACNTHVPHALFISQWNSEFEVVIKLHGNYQPAAPGGICIVDSFAVTDVACFPMLRTHL